MLLDPRNPKHVHVDQRLHSEIMMWLTSVRPDGRPHIVPVWFLWDGGSIFIFSQPNKQKLRNIEANPSVMLALDTADEGEDIAMFEGTAVHVNVEDYKAILPVYAEKYKAGIARLGWTPESMRADFSQLIRVTPTRVLAW